MIQWRRLSVFCVLVLAPGAEFTAAQNGQEQGLTVRRSRLTGHATFLTARGGGAIPVTPAVANAVPAPLDVLVQYRGLFGMDDPATQLRLKRTDRDALGYSHSTFEQVHRGVPVFGGALKTHQNARGEFVAANGDFFPVSPKLSPVPVLDRMAAERVALAAAPQGGFVVESAHLTVVDPGWYGDRPMGAKLAYFIRTTEPATGRAEAFFVDAQTGAILDRWNLVETLRNREVHDAEGTPSIPGPVVRVEVTPPTGNTEVDRAFDYAGDTYDYYFRGLGRDSLNDQGLKLILTVNSTAAPCPNAFWDGSQAAFCTGLTLDDVVAHELTHGVVQYTAGLIYQNQPGQLNESFADVFGELVDLFNGDVSLPGPPAGTPWPVHGSGPGLDFPNNPRGDECVGGTSIDVHPPSPLAGTYIAGRALYGPVPTQSGLSGRLVLVDPPLGCPAGVVFNNAAQIAGHIAVIDAGDCSFVEKSANAQNAGAIGAVFISGRPGPPPNPVGVDPAIVIPSVTLTQFEGDPIRAALMDGALIDITMRTNSTENGFRWNLAESSPGIMFRDMWKPTCRGHPDRANHPFQTCNPADNGGVHSGSGVPNHAFSLVTDGGEFNGLAIEGIGAIKSGAVWYRALASYLTAASDFEDAYAALNQAAADLVGAFPLDPRTGFPSNEVFSAHDAEQIDLALRAVEMDTPGLCGSLDYIFNPAPPAFCPSRVTMYEDGFEHGIADWTVANSGPPTPYDWTQTSALPDPMPGMGWFAEDPDLGDCASVDESAVHSLFSPPITLFENAFNSALTFTHFVATESAFDGGNVSLSVNGGPFSLLPADAFTYNTYNTAIDATSSNPLAGQPAFSGHGAQWGTSIVDLSGLAGPGDLVQFRFDFGKDGCQGIDGWYVSDLAVYTCLPAGSGDFDFSGRIDLRDLASFQRCMGRSARGSSGCAPGDLNGSTVVNLGDFGPFVDLLTGP